MRGSNTDFVEQVRTNTANTSASRVWGHDLWGLPFARELYEAAQGRRIKRYPEDEQREALRLVMQHPQARRIFSQRKAIVEPVFSSLRSQQGLNRFRRRGLQAVKREFALHVLAHNLSRAVALSRALFTLLHVVLRGLHAVAHSFSDKLLDLLARAKAITFTPGLQLDAQQKRFATASSWRGGRARRA